MVGDRWRAEGDAQRPAALTASWLTLIANEGLMIDDDNDDDDDGDEGFPPTSSRNRP